MGGFLPFYVYILRSESNGRTYVGQTADLDRRVAQHNDPNCTLTKHTKNIPGPWRLIHSEQYATRSEAMSRERELKSGKGREWIRNTLLSKEAGGC
ncbi:MAG TPA: GIY-YIG nuclease family protein [Candidatus Hydrogenedentes bacterium]|nr:GIY-YIG nuclease family protein [Candidatus Hydrogenedentota bacterium]